MSLASSVSTKFTRAGDFNTEASIIVTETLFEGDSLLTGFSHTVTMDDAQYAAAATQFGVQVGGGRTLRTCTEMANRKPFS